MDTTINGVGQRSTLLQLAQATLCGVYLITNTVNGKMYVGQSVDIRTRLLAHIFSVGGSLHREITKYGAENFAVEILSITSMDQLDEHERCWISILGSQHPHGYNISRGGEGVRAVRRRGRLLVPTKTKSTDQ